MTTLNLGCGADKRGRNTVNADISPDVEPDVVVDLERTPWPWETGTFGRIVASHVLEHLEPVPWGEIKRVAAPGAILELTYPIGHTRFEDPTHKQFWNINTAEFLAGRTEHTHELPIELKLVDKNVYIQQADRVTRIITAFKELLWGMGPWIEQTPGVSGEVQAVYEVVK